MSNLRLVYFPVRARAECARMILAYGGISYKVVQHHQFDYKAISKTLKEKIIFF